jgi:ABC-2 type transport system permease protein
MQSLSVVQANSKVGPGRTGIIRWEAVYVIWLRDLKRFARARSRLAGNIVQPFFLLALLGIGFRSSVIVGIPMDLSTSTFPGIVAIVVLSSSIYAGTSLIADRQFGVMQEFLVGPVSRQTIVLGKTLGGATIASIQRLVTIGVALILGVKITVGGMLLGILVVILTVLSAVLFGLSIASQIDDLQGFQPIMNLLAMPAIFTSSAVFPIEGLPQ